MKAENNLDRETCVISAGRQAGKLSLACIGCQATVPGAFCLVHLMKTNRKTHTDTHAKTQFSCFIIVILLTF